MHWNLSIAIVVSLLVAGCASPTNDLETTGALSIGASEKENSMAWSQDWNTTVEFIVSVSVANPEGEPIVWGNRGGQPMWKVYVPQNTTQLQVWLEIDEANMPPADLAIYAQVESGKRVNHGEALTIENPGAGWQCFDIDGNPVAVDVSAMLHARLEGFGNEPADIRVEPIGLEESC